MDIFGKVDAPESSLMRTQIYLTGREHPIYPNSSGHFQINNLPKGEYLLRILGPEYVYDSYILQITEQESKDGTRLVCKKSVFDFKTGKPGAIVNSYVLNIKPLYSTKTESDNYGGLQNLLSLLKNPLVLISAVSLGITFILPMLQESLDAEAMEEITGSIPGGNYVSNFLTKIS
ncbi:Uncharacterized protein CPATCC_0036520 [Cryptosporidium parvum]|uniref:ER membrane protein complex subunit 7 beta-sandwich domain-containing protein n=1 Tax=Cryptosporidium parvum TaxID=5807 RepID=A0A7S7RHX4_CRYPV|nr:Uncharacterized protein CPATCC_0036520 [Cryptosporidium parvum]|eukprot:QOY43346.1 hypothetical protein CPATCC_000125 [Cryptosporidium parvum]